MDIINVLEYSLDVNDVLTFTVNIPKGTYIKEFYISDSKDVLANKGVKVTDVYLNLKYKYTSPIACFNALFNKIGGTNTYDTYVLTDTFTYENGKGIKLDRDALTFITIVLSPYNNHKEDSLTFPVYDNMLIKTRVLEQAKVCKNCNQCSIDNSFIDSLLQLKALEVSLELKDYMFASELWNKINNSIETINS